MEQRYRVRIARKDSVTEVVYNNVVHVWWQGDHLAIIRGARGKDRNYIYYPNVEVDHVHIEEE